MGKLMRPGLDNAIKQARQLVRQRADALRAAGLTQVEGEWVDSDGKPVGSVVRSVIVATAST